MKKYPFIYQSWWKWLTLVILLYVFIVGFWVPLKPGIMSVSDFQLKTGQDFVVYVETYNTRFTPGSSEVRAFLKLDSIQLLELKGVDVIARTQVKLKGLLPALPSGSSQIQDATLLLHSEQEGYMILPSAFAISTDSEGYNIMQPWDAQLPAYQEGGFAFPYRAILYETVRNTFFHVAIWMAMFVLLIISLIYSIRYLRSRDLMDDAVASCFAYVAVGFGILGMITGMIWAKATWGTYWTDDPKLNMSAVSMMIFLAYAILRSAISDNDRRAQISAPYNVFAFAAMIPLIFIVPRLAEIDSLHPGNGGNPALGGEDLDSTLRAVFYPAIIGYTLLGVWLSSILYRLRKLQLNNILQDLISH